MARVVVLVIATILMAIAAVAFHLVMTRMVDEINRDRAPAAQESHYWWNAAKLWRVIDEYRRRFPHGDCWPRLVLSWMAGIVGFVLAVRALDIIG